MTMDARDLLGVWMLDTFKLEDRTTGEVTLPFGPAPSGTIVFHPEGRFFALLTSGGAEATGEPAEASRKVVAYSGRYSLEPDRFVTRVDIASLPHWIGSQQVRYWQIEGGRLRLTSEPLDLAGAEGMHPTVWWRREDPPAAD